jgi:dipeptidyl aminopeptidase/acylaminoacyl peptidase
VSIANSPFDARTSELIESLAKILEAPAMTSTLFRRTFSLLAVATIALLVSTSLKTFAAANPADTNAAPKPMQFLDILNLRSAGGTAVSPDGKWLLYTLTVPDWKAARSYSDIHLVSLEKGASSTRQMTFTKDKNETSPRWSRDGRFFVFTSNREAAPPTGGTAAATPATQLYLMRPDGGEARKLTDNANGVEDFAFSKDGKWLAYSTGREDSRQVWIFSTATIETDVAKALTKHTNGIRAWQFSPDSRRIYFTAPDRVDKDNSERKTKRFDVRVRNEDTSLVHLWAFDLDTRKESRLTSGTNYSVSGVTISKDAKWIGFHGSSPSRLLRTITDAPAYANLHLLEVATGQIEQLTDNKDISESSISFSPDSSLLAFAADDDFKFFHNKRVYVRRVSDQGGKFRKLGDGFDSDAGTGFWSKDSKTIYFNEGLRAANHVFALSVESGKVQPLTKAEAATTASLDEESQTLLLTHSNPREPTELFTVASARDISDRGKWKRLTDSNPQIRKIALGETETVQWKSTDGKMVEGILVKPVGYQPGRRYPLVVQIHGGPQSAVVLNFNGSSSYYSHVFAGAGYVCFLPNYRGSSNYGQRHKMEIGGDYFRQAYDDIMAGVDWLIAQGIVDGDKMGVMGWSAGGHWSNWILTHTDRFKAISSGAGAVNWISMYAQSDTQRVREFYYGGQPPYEDFAKYWDVSPLKFIKNAKTPTLIHVVDGDPRVPRPQSEELHMALKKLGVPTELFVYPGNTHGITEPRNQLVKMVSEFNWMEKWIRGRTNWFEWKDLLDTVKDVKAEETATPSAASSSTKKGTKKR